MSEAELKAISNRLRGQYPVGPLDENGKPEFGWRDMSGNYNGPIPSPLMLEAAEIIDQLRQQLEAAQSHINCLEDAITERDNALAEVQRMQSIIKKAQEQKPTCFVDADNLCDDGTVGGFCNVAPCETQYYKLPLYAYPPILADHSEDVQKSTFSLWWSMVEAEHDLAGEPIKDNEIILHYMGCGAICQVTAGDIRKMLGRNQSEVKPS